MSVFWFLAGVASGAAGMFLTLVVLVTRKLVRELGPIRSWPKTNRSGILPDTAVKEKVRVGETVAAVLAGANGKKRRVGG